MDTAQSCYLVVFDLDGTLNRTDLFSVPAIQMVQKELGFPISSRETIISCYGTAYREFMSVLFPGGTEQTARDYQRLIPEAEAQFLYMARPYEGVPELLTALRKQGYQTAVCSNSNYRYISTALKAIGVYELIDWIQELEKGMETKTESLACLLQKTQAQKAVMVGDTFYDYHAAQDNHIPFIGCGYGFRPYEMETLSPVVKAPMEILPFVEQQMQKQS